MILVTGATGFSGSRIVARLAEQGARPRAMAHNRETALARLPRQGIEVAIADITRPETLRPALEGVETIIHCAFITADQKPGPGVNYYETNTTGTRNLIAAAKAAGVTRIVELGGLGTQPGRPGSYMETRYLADEALKQSGLAWSSLGSSVQFGKQASFFRGLADLITSVPLITPVIGSGAQRFQPIWVDDVVTCILKMAQEPARYDGRVIEVGGPEIYTYNEILDMLMEALGKRRIKVPGPKPIARLVASAMTALLAKPPITPAAIELFEFENTTTLDAVPYNFGFQPASLRAWIAQNGVA
ncbi:MAG TPA: NAD(P)H-binding protein [Ktedonobacterales bacterium]|nr:NAD(P)H-binding protein [Ktedonobacterales bacterium]